MGLLRAQEALDGCFPDVSLDIRLPRLQELSPGATHPYDIQSLDTGLEMAAAF